jgi:sugar/nucleoside kinase (ribokinase family)
MPEQRKYRLCGFGNAIVDIFVQAEDHHLTTLALDKGSMRLVDHQEQTDLLGRLGGHIEDKVSGGSVANSVAAFAQLGGPAALIATLGDDEWGSFYVEECGSMGIAFEGVRYADGTTGTCLSVVTPDAERTMRTCLAASSRLGPEHASEEVLRNSEWLFVEGYPFSNPERGQRAALQAVRVGKQQGAKVALTCSDAWVIEGNREALMEALQGVDLLFANEIEAMTLTHTSEIEAAYQRLRELVPAIAVTRGPLGAWVSYQGQDVRVPSPAVAAIDATGAGDMFAGSFLYGLTHGLSVEDAALRACFMASRIITQVGARFREGARVHWDMFSR